MKKLKAKQRKVNGQVTYFEQRVEHNGLKYVIPVGEGFGGDASNPHAHVNSVVAEINKVTPNQPQTVVDEEVAPI